MVRFGRMQGDHKPIIWRTRLDFDRVCRIPQFYRARRPQQFNRTPWSFGVQGQQSLTERQILQHKILARAEYVDDPADERSAANMGKSYRKARS